MESSKEPVSVRIARLNALVLGKTKNIEQDYLVCRESLLDALQALYDECSIENLQKSDKKVAKFIQKYKCTIKLLKQLRVNLSDFEIKQAIGRGHFGEVHVVKEKQTGDVYALKTIRKNSVNEMLFEEERNIMAYGNSQWLTSLQYAFQDNCYLYLVMDFHPGGDLLGLLHRQGGTIPESAAVFYLAEVVLALSDLHNLGYVHRDIKPDNILLDRCGHLKLADFGSSAKLNVQGFVEVGPPVGTPEYIAPEVLMSYENDNKTNVLYGVCCDFWSLGVLAYELTVGSTPFIGRNTTEIYSKIMKHKSNLKFPPDITLTQGYVSFIKALVTDKANRLNYEQIVKHTVFKETNLDSLRDQVPPYVPKISSSDDTSNFVEVQMKKKEPSIDNFKRKTQFSGRNLPFIGFTFSPIQDEFTYEHERRITNKNEIITNNLKAEIDLLKRKLMKFQDYTQEKENLEKKLGDKLRKLENVESVRDKLERDLANSIAESTALKRTLELERKDRSELEKKALDLIKAAKLKWETAERGRVESLSLEIEQQKEKILQLTNTNNILNDQLRHALKNSEKHKESLDKVEHLSRRSVIGLESRLEKVSNETHNQISELQLKLSQEVRSKQLVEIELEKYKVQEKSLTEKLNIVTDNYDLLKSKVNEAEDVIHNLVEQVNLLEKQSEDIVVHKTETEKLKEHLMDSNKTIKELENKMTLLQIENDNIALLKNKIAELQQTISSLQNDKRINELESQLFEEKEKCASLQKQLEATEKFQCEVQEMKDLRTKVWKMEKEFSNCKIDKRILERELKEAEAQIKQLTAEIETFNQKLDSNKQIHEAAMVELSNMNESLSMDLVKAKETVKNLESQLTSEKEKFFEEKTILNEMKTILKGKDNRIETLEKEIVSLQDGNSKLKQELKNNEKHLQRVNDMAESLSKEKSTLINDLENTKRTLNTTNMNLEALREACTLIENQLIEYEKINSMFQSKQDSLNKNTEQLIKDLCKAKEDIQEAKKMANEEKSLKLLAESKIKRLNEDLIVIKEECNTYKEKCEEYKQYCTDLTEELTMAEEKITDSEVSVKSYKRQVADFIGEIKSLKEERSDLLTQILYLKESNHKLNRNISDHKATNSSLLHRIKELESLLNEKVAYYKERDLKSESTIRQQTKLIDYLQYKIDEHNNKKKTFSELLFGNSKKENQQPFPLTKNYKDLETQLAKEKKANRLLQEEIFQLQAENIVKQNRNISHMMESKCELVKTKQAPHLTTHKSFSEISSSTEDCISHRFEVVNSEKTVIQICYQCDTQIIPGNTLKICRQCSIGVHPHCVSSLQTKCAPVETVKFQIIAEGFIKYRKDNVWLKKYARLTEMYLYLYNDSESKQTCETLQLKSEKSHGKLILEPIKSELDGNINTSDLPLIFNIEIAPNTTCWPPNCYYFMALSLEDREIWVKALQQVFEEDINKTRIHKVVTITPKIEVNCLVELNEDLKILGTENGLFSYFNDTLLQIQGLNEVESIVVIKKINLVLMIADSDKVLISCDFNHLINIAQSTPCIKPQLIYDLIRVKDLNGFHILQESDFVLHQKIAIANSRQIILMNFDLDMSCFVPMRILDTAEPSSCMLFTEHSLIVGANKFFEIDLNTFEAEEFLDTTDNKLKYVSKCYKMGSFPVSILQVSKNPKEYLVSFNEFSVFVDEYGHSSRNFEFKSHHLPRYFYYSHPLLYIIEMSAVEIIKINNNFCNDTDQKDINKIRVKFSHLKYLGSNKNGIYISEENNIKYLEGQMFLDIDNSLTEIDTQDANDESDKFSFTSSMVQSLDGNLSDSSNNDHANKKVTFSETNF